MSSVILGYHIESGFELICCVFIEVPISIFKWIEKQDKLIFEEEGGCCGNTQCFSCKVKGYSIDLKDYKVMGSREILEFQASTKVNKESKRIVEWLNEQYQINRE